MLASMLNLQSKAPSTTAASVGPARPEYLIKACAACATILAFALMGCAVPGRPIASVPGEPVPLRGFTVTLPPSPDWKGRDLSSVEGGIYLAFGRELGPTRTVLAAASDIVAPARASLYENQVVDKSDPERLAFTLDAVEHNAPAAEPGAVEGFWRGPADRPVVRQKVACQEYGYETVDLRVPGHSGEPFRMVLRGLVCLDPDTGRPVQITYSERYMESGERLRPEFESELNTYFDSLTVNRMPAS